jgi:hypothetical protein
MAEEKKIIPEEKPTKVNEEKSKVNSFLLILLVSIFAIVGAYTWTTCDYKTRQQNIIDAQNNQLSKLDSIMGSFYNESMKLSKDTTYYKVLLDSISKSKNKKQSYADSIVKSVISAAIRTQNNRELTEQIRRDSIFVHTQIGQIQNDTKSQLTLEFNKLQNEYFTLQLWGGILTIVFLIFTFYSLFKTDDLMKQGRDSVNDIFSLKKEGLKEFKEINDQYNELNKNFGTLKTDIENTKTSFTNDLKLKGDTIKADISQKVENEVTQTKAKLLEIERKGKDESDARLKDFQVRFDEMMRKYISSLDSTTTTTPTDEDKEEITPDDEDNGATSQDNKSIEEKQQ